MPHTPKTLTTNATDLLAHLVRMPTLTGDTATCRASLDWVQAQLEGLPLKIKRYERNGFPSLVAISSGVKDPQAPKLWLVGHIDVVPGPTEAFEPKIENGRLYGRGVHDMKFAIAVFIAILQDLGQELAHYDLGLMLTSDEEVGGYDGVHWLVNSLGVRGQIAINPDSGGSWDMELGSKGVVWWEVEAHGTGAHASRTWEGQNAADRLIKFVEQLKSHVPTEPCGDVHHNHATVNLGSFSTGTTTANQVPAYAIARIDARFPPELNLDEVQSWINEASMAVPGITFKQLVADSPYKVADSQAIAAFRQIVREVTGHDVNPTTAHGSSDARHFAKHGISTINVCPTGSGSHVPIEWVDIEDLERFSTIVRRFAEDWARS